MLLLFAALFVHLGIQNHLSTIGANTYKEEGQKWLYYVFTLTSVLFALMGIWIFQYSIKLMNESDDGDDSH